MMLQWPEVWQPPLGWAGTLALLGAVAAMSVRQYVRHRGRGEWLRRTAWLALRLCAIAATAWVLAGPGRHVPAAATGPRPVVRLLIDTSESMAQADVPLEREQHARLAAVSRTWLNADAIARWRDAARLDVLGFADDVQALGDTAPAATGTRTRLAHALDEVAATTPDGPALAVVLSDGHDTEVGPPAAAGARLREAGWQVLAVPVGSPAEGAALSLHAWPEADRLFDGQRTAIHAQVTHRGLRGTDVAVDLHHQGRLADTRVVTVVDDAPLRLKFDIAPVTAAGQLTQQHAYDVRARLLDGEGVDDHTAPPEARRWVFIDTTRQKLRVAMFEGQPYWDSRFLARHLARDPQVELHSFTQITPQRVATTHEGDDASPPPLRSYDVVVLGKGVEVFFGGDAARELADYVEQGGVLILARGQAFSGDSAAGRAAQAHIAHLEPVTWGQRVLGGLTAQWPTGGDGAAWLADLAPRWSAALTQLPDLVAATVVEGPRAASVVVLEQHARGESSSSAMALVAHQRVGEGRVLAVLGDGLWQWAMLPSSLAEHESIYTMFWSRAVRWLAAGGEFLPGQDWALQLSTLAPAPGKPLQLTATPRYPVEAASVRVTGTGPDGSTQAWDLTAAQPGVAAYHGTLELRAQGVWTLQLTTPEGTTLRRQVAVHDPDVELQDVSARPQWLADLAAEAGGQCIGLADIDEVDRWLAAQAAARTTEARVEPMPLSTWMLGLAAAALTAEWITRRLGGWA